MHVQTVGLIGGEFLSHLLSVLIRQTGEAIPMVMKINTGLGNPCPFQEPFVYEATSFLYKSLYLDSVHITVYLT